MMHRPQVFLYQPTTGYRYNSDTIFLYDFIRQFNPKGRILDVGCGVGILGLLVKKDFPVDVNAIDIRQDMIFYTKHNFLINGFDVDVSHGDFTQASFENQRFDFIVSNPPFYHCQVEQSADIALNTARYAHHLPLEVMIRKVKSLLKPRGYFIFCYDAKQIDEVLAEIKKNKLNVEALRFVHSKIERNAKLALISVRSSSKSLTRIFPPLIVFDTANRYRQEALQAFHSAGTHVISADLESDYPNIIEM